MKKPSGYVERSSVALTHLHLDLENPRYEGITDEAAAAAYLLRYEKVEGLAKDIVERGDVSPLERLAAIPMEGVAGHFVMVEGNRRLCALKMLRDPASAPTPPSRKMFEALAKRIQTPPSTLSLVVFDTRELARQWIALRHSGAQGGAGTRPWNSTQSSRFAHQDTPNRLALAVLDRATQAGWITQQERKAIALTTLTRYLSSPVIRSVLGLGDRRDLLFTHAPEEVDVALRRFIDDAAPKEGASERPVNSRANKAEREAYAHQLRAEVAPRTLLTDPIVPPPAQPGRKSKRSSRSASHRPNIVPSDFVMKSKDKATTKIFNELRRVQAEDFPFAANYLLRAFLERVMVRYATKIGRHHQQMTDRKLVNACIAGFEVEDAPLELYKAMRVAGSDDDAPHSLHTLGSMVHTRMHPTPQFLVQVWDNWQPEVEWMLARC